MSTLLRPLMAKAKNPSLPFLRRSTPPTPLALGPSLLPPSPSSSNGLVLPLLQATTSTALNSPLATQPRCRSPPTPCWASSVLPLPVPAPKASSTPGSSPTLPPLLRSSRITPSQQAIILALCRSSNNGSTMPDLVPSQQPSGPPNQEPSRTSTSPTPFRPQTQLQEQLCQINSIKSSIWYQCQEGSFSLQDAQPLLLQLDRAQTLLLQLLLSMQP